MAEDTVDAVVQRLGESPKRRKCVTKSLRLIGYTSASRDPVAMSRPQAHLIGRYGTHSADVLALAEGRPELLEPVVEGLPYTGAEMLFAAREEMAQTLTDVLTRRTRSMIQRAQPTMAAAHAIANLIAPELGWSEEEALSQANAFVETCEKELLTAGLDLT
jgi:glycerol-3-phosphate dehydrogenase